MGGIMLFINAQCNHQVCIERDAFSYFRDEKAMIQTLNCCLVFSLLTVTAVSHKFLNT